MGGKRRTHPPPSTFLICFLGRKNQKLVWCPRLVNFYLLWTDLIAFCPALISLRVSAFDATFCPKTKLWEYQTAQNLKSPQKNQFSFPPKYLIFKKKMRKSAAFFLEISHYSTMTILYTYTPLASFSVLYLMTWCGEDGRISSVKKKPQFMCTLYILHIECLELMRLCLRSLLIFLEG